MTTLRRPFDPADVAASVVPATLADPAPAPVIARYPGQAISFLAAAPDADGSFDLSWAATGGVRILDPAETPALGVDVLVELSPLPFGLEAVMRALAPGVPTFYIGFTGAPAPGDNDLVRTDDPPFSVTNAVIGIVFQDRITLQPWAWIDLIGDALDAAGLAADAAAFRALAPLVDAVRSVRVVDAAGRPAGEESFVLRVRDSGGTELSSTMLTSSPDGDLGTEPIVPAGRSATLEWQRPLSVVTYYEGAVADSSAQQNDDSVRAVPVAGEEVLELPAGFAGGHLQLLDLVRWLAPAVPNPVSPDWPAQFRAHSHMLPIVDGVETFRLLVDDLRACRVSVPGQGGAIQRGGAHLAGWAFKDFELLPGDATTTLKALADFIRTAPATDPDQHGDVRILAAEFLQAKPALFTTADEAARIAVAIFVVAAFFAGYISLKNDFTDTAGILTWELGGAVLAAYALEKLLTASDLEATAKDLVEQTKPALIEELNDSGIIALYSRHPAELSDNPLATDFDVGLFTLGDLDSRFGIFHQKLQVVRRSPDGDHPDSGDGFHWAGYVGGIDFNENRIDTPGHHGKRSFHDVHSRVTGPAVLDLVGTFHDRWERDRQADTSAPGPALTPPAALDPAGGHIIQVGRTAFRPAPGGEGFEWAPNGDTMTRETIGLAFEAAREYIYIEDQYFAPDNEYVELLRAAADHCRRLVVVMPSEPDQPLSTDRVFQVFGRLSGATGPPGGGWGERMFIGAPLRRPVLVPTDKISSIGRCFLVEDVADADAGQIFLGPPTRVPKTTPYFVWVGGELMAAQDATLVTTTTGKQAMQLDVVRGGLGTQPRWYEHPRAHPQGEPATIVRMKGIYVHSKTIMVDDVFVGIGSTNTNRRGFFHDGEMTAFAIPERLRAARDNPAVGLRTALWAEHLGIPPAMGRTLLADPIGAFDLFKRTRYQGNRLARFRELQIPFAGTNKLAGLLPDSLQGLGLAISAFALSVVEAQREAIWNTLSDPTTTAEGPSPQDGPDLP